MMEKLDVSNVKLVASDLDGTILPNGGEVSQEDLKTIYDFREAGVLSALVTGRSMFSFRRSLPDGLPFDYIIFSTGAAIWDNRLGELIRCRNLQPADTQEIANVLLDMQLDFMLQHAVPDNHHFTYHTPGTPPADFLRRLDIYQGYHDTIDNGDTAFKASQAIIILPRFDEVLFNTLEKRLSRYKIVRTTSPIDRESVWIEVFPKGISKGHALKELCGILGISLKDVCAIGNDFNDIDMLEIVRHSFVVEGSPAELEKKYKQLPARSPLKAIFDLITM